MPSTKQYGTESRANAAIGGIPTIHYFDFKSRGRGQVVRLLLIDADAAFKDVRYSFDEWPAAKRTGAGTKNPTGNIPIVEMPNGAILTQSYAILRHWARQLNAYDGTTEDEKYFVDLITDVVIDWRTRFVDAFFAGESAYATHEKEARPAFLKAVEQHLKASDLAKRGAFVLGHEISYADFVVYQVCHDESLTQEGRKGLQGYERLIKLVDAVEARPNVKRFLESEDYLG